MPQLTEYLRMHSGRNIIMTQAEPLIAISTPNEKQSIPSKIVAHLCCQSSILANCNTGSFSNRFNARFLVVPWLLYTCTICFSPFFFIHKRLYYIMCLLY
ncbi:hypothetical protein ABZP36_026561 [Zizania latifolia]